LLINRSKILKEVLIILFPDLLFMIAVINQIRIRWRRNDRVDKAIRIVERCFEA